MVNRRAITSTKQIRAEYVEALQDAVQRCPEFGDDFKARVQKANDSLSSKLVKTRKPRLSLSVYSEGTSDPALRVTCPSRSVVSAEIPPPLAPECVEFYLTRPRADGLAETRLLGVTKYKDGDGKWNLTFTTERFARRPKDPLVIHAEVLDEVSRLLAATAVSVID